MIFLFFFNKRLIIIKKKKLPMRFYENYPLIFCKKHTIFNWVKRTNFFVENLTFFCQFRIINEKFWNFGLFSIFWWRFWSFIANEKTEKIVKFEWIISFLLFLMLIFVWIEFLCFFVTVFCINFFFFFCFSDSSNDEQFFHLNYNKIDKESPKYEQLDHTSTYFFNFFNF